jgi:hypothetical protein
MLQLRSTDVLEFVRQSQKVSDDPSCQPRGLPLGMTPPPPAELSGTPGAEDAAQRAAYRAQLIDVIRVQQEALPVVAARSGYRGLIFGTVTGVGFLALRHFWEKRR